jgi:hypothetical protein
MISDMANAVCGSPISRTNNASTTKLTSTKLNADFNAAYTRVNELPGDCVTDATLSGVKIIDETVTSAKITNGTIVNADIAAAAAIAMSKIAFSVAHLSESQTTGSASGTFTSGAWRTRTLNTEVDTDGIVTLSANQFTLLAGTYLVIASAPAYKVDAHKAILVNITDTTNQLLGSNEASAAADTTGTRSWIIGSFTIAATKVFEIQHRAETTAASNGFGKASGLFSVNEDYTNVLIVRMK